MRPWAHVASPDVLRFRSLASSSAGNATLIEARAGTQTTRILVDCGLGVRTLAQRLEAAGVAPADLAAIFITHEHSDHVGSVLRFAPRHGIPVWTSAGTWAHISTSADAEAITPHIARDDEIIALGALQIHPFTVPHDAREPLQLRCTDGDHSLGILTDIGHVTEHARRALTGCHALMLESNHDLDLLAHSAYPEFLRQRIAGDLGHLNNEQAHALLQSLNSPQLGVVVGAHLSERNNRPEIVRRSFASALGRSEGDVWVSSRHGLDWLPV